MVGCRNIFCLSHEITALPSKCNLLCPMCFQHLSLPIFIFIFNLENAGFGLLTMSCQHLCFLDILDHSQT